MASSSPRRPPHRQPLRARRTYKPYPSDLTDAQWALIEAMIPAPDASGPGTPGGGQVIHDRRRILEGILYVARSGCAWRMLPHDFPVWETVYSYFQTWSEDGTLDRVHDALRAKVRDGDQRDPMASAGVIDSASLDSADTVGSTTGSPGTTPADLRGYDAGKRINGRKRHLVVDTTGLVIAVLVTSASVQDRDGGITVLERAKMAMPSLALVWADGAYSRRVQDFAARILKIGVQVVSKIPGQKGFAPLPRRWVVERTHAWLSTWRRLARDYERLHTTGEAMVKWAMTAVMARRLAPGTGRRPWSPNVTTR